MKSASNNFRRGMENGIPIICYASVAFSNGGAIELGPDDDFMADGNCICDSSGSDGFPLGAAVAKTITINLDNSDGRYSSYDFYHSRITLYTAMEFSDGTTEKIKEGTFTVIDSVTPGDILEINAINDMYKADITYYPKVSAPTTLLNILQDVCGLCDINLGTAALKNGDYVVQELPENVTCRSVIGYISQIAGGNAFCDENNRLIIKTYDFSVFESAGIIDARPFKENVEDSIDGGSFGEDMADCYDSGDFGENEEFHSLYDWTELNLSTDDVVITGVSTVIQSEESDENDEEYLSGSEGYVLNIDNPLIAGNEKDAIDRIAAILVGIIIRPFDGKYTTFALAEFMDPCIVWDKKNNMHESFLTDIEFVYGGKTSLANRTDPPLKNQSTYYSNATEAYRRARQEARKQKTEWEKAMNELSERLENSSGLYTTIEKQSDGSSVFYLHDKKTISESQIIWKQTAEAWGVSTNGGKTWSAGMTVDGTVIAKILNTIGINADWIRSGKIYSANYEAGKSGAVFDLDSGNMTCYGFNSYTNHYFKISVSASGILLDDLTDSNNSVHVTLNNITMSESEYNRRIEISPGFIWIVPTDFQGGSVRGFRIDATGMIIPLDFPVQVQDNSSGSIYSAKTGRAEFSDGSYLDFKNGLLTGGKTSDGTNI